MNLKKVLKQPKTAVVTGSAGIGLGIARRLLKDGFGVVICGNNTKQNQEAEQVLAGLPAFILELDVSIAKDVEQFAIEIKDKADNLDALVNCAGIQTYGTIETTTPAEWNHVMGVNLTGYYLMAHFLYPLLKANGAGAIVNIASVQGYQNQNNVLGYATSKGAIHALTRAMAVDCAKDGVRVNSVSPGSIRTPLLEFAAQELTPAGGNAEDTLNGFGQSHPIGRVGTAEEVGALVAYLVSDQSGFCIGGDFPIDGGLKAILGV